MHRCSIACSMVPVSSRILASSRSIRSTSSADESGPVLSRGLRGGRPAVAEHAIEQRCIAVLRKRKPRGTRAGGHNQPGHRGSEPSPCKPMGDQANYVGKSGCRRFFSITARSRPKCDFRRALEKQTGAA